MLLSDVHSHIGHSHGPGDHDHDHDHNEHDHSHQHKHTHPHSHGNKVHIHEKGNRSHSHSHSHGHAPSQFDKSWKDIKKANNSSSDGSYDYPRTDMVKNGILKNSTSDPKGRVLIGIPNDSPSISASSSTISNQHATKGGHLNMHGMYLHIMGDALGNVAVIISALVNMYADGGKQSGKSHWKYYIDPLVSLIIVAILTYSTIPLLKTTLSIVLQSAPESLPIPSITRRIKRIPGVIDIHEFHIWQLSEIKSVASIHVVIEKTVEAKKNGMVEISTKDAILITDRIQKLLHARGVHNTTVQVEYWDSSDAIKYSGGCLSKCFEGDCEKKSCCPPNGTNVDEDDSFLKRKVKKNAVKFSELV